MPIRRETLLLVLSGDGIFWLEHSVVANFRFRKLEFKSQEAGKRKFGKEESQANTQYSRANIYRLKKKKITEWETVPEKKVKQTHYSGEHLLNRDWFLPDDKLNPCVGLKIDQTLDLRFLALYLSHLHINGMPSQMYERIPEKINFFIDLKFKKVFLYRSQVQESIEVLPNS